MGVQQIAEMFNRSLDAVLGTVGRWILCERMDGDEETAITASVTRYFNLGIAPFPCTLKQASIRAKGIGVGASTTIDLLKLPSGTAVASGVAMITQIAANALVANTNYKCAISSVTGAATLAVGDSVFLKVVSQATETLTPPTVTALFE